MLIVNGENHEKQNVCMPPLYIYIEHFPQATDTFLELIPD
jgi:hypothetical protein